MTKRITDAYNVSQTMHRGQVDRAGIDYFHGHILTVFNYVGGFTADEDVAITALLHDIVEDTSVTIKEIRGEFGDTIADAVKLLTRTRKLSNNQIDFDYLDGIKGNEIARIVKLADLKHNSDLNRLSKVNDEDRARAEKYMKCIDYLSN